MDGVEAVPLLRRVVPGWIGVGRSNRDEDEAAAAIDAGAKLYLPKFMSPDDLRVAIEQATKPHLSAALRAILASYPYPSRSREARA